MGLQVLRLVYRFSEGLSPRSILRRPNTSRIGLTILMAVAAIPAQAVVFWTGSLTAGDPKFNRPANMSGTSFSATQVFYDVQPFFVSQDGSYIFESGQTFDGFILVYANTFNPAAPMSGLRGGGDDFTPDPFSPNLSDRNELISPWNFDFGSKLDSFANGFGSLTLTGGTQYFAVTTTFSNGTTGNYFNAIGGGPGAVNLGVVPEPATVIALLFGVGASARKRRRPRAQVDRSPCKNP